MAIVHVMNGTVRRCFLFGEDELTGRNYDYRKDWIELRMEYLAQYYGIDVLCYSILSNHFHHPRLAIDRCTCKAGRTSRRARGEAKPIRLSMHRSSFLNTNDRDYIDLLDWTAQVVVLGKRGDLDCGGGTSTFADPNRSFQK